MESRKHSRVTCNLRAGCFWDDVFTFDEIVNVSEGGAFLQTVRPSQPKEKVSLRIFFPRVKEPFDVNGEVVWSTRKPARKKSFSMQGIGIRFSFLEEELKNRLRQFIDSED
ncbi:MAG: PilZ domain-containing protein [Deltaproteobacteria bacterium]|nr:MAG: PilZ domain-containing protein [Deltaproteobacteria bacterium]